MGQPTAVFMLSPLDDSVNSENKASRLWMSKLEPKDRNSCCSHVRLGDRSLRFGESFVVYQREFHKGTDRAND